MSDESPEPNRLTLSQFLMGAALFEGGLLLVSFLLGWLVEIHPTAELTWSLRDFGFGLLATIPMLLMMGACWLSRNEGLTQIREFLRDVLGPFLDRCRLIDILFLALLAGICEEVLFRGLVFQFIRPFNLTLAVIITSLLFAAAHAITSLYAFLAGFLGLYLTALMCVNSSPNLLIPMTAHAAYDFVGFLLVLRDYRNRVESDST